MVPEAREPEAPVRRRPSRVEDDDGQRVVEPLPRHRWNRRRARSSIVVSRPALCGNQIYGAFVLNRHVTHAIGAMPARWRGDDGSSARRSQRGRVVAEND